MTFIEQTLRPDVFWDAMAAIGTFLAVLTALLLPKWTQHKRNSHIEMLIKAEVEDNLSKIKLIHHENFTVRDGPLAGTVLPAAQKNDAVIEFISLKVWDEFKFELAVHRPQEFKKFSKLNENVEQLLSMSSITDNFKAVMQHESAKKFLTAYHEEL